MSWKLMLRTIEGLHQLYCSSLVSFIHGRFGELGLSSAWLPSSSSTSSSRLL
uniref:Uncharacterized protein n=1 Tax=Vitis vinifera TaxID=29760 RepID=F6HN45_VITVI